MNTNDSLNLTVRMHAQITEILAIKLYEHSCDTQYPARFETSPSWTALGEGYREHYRRMARGEIGFPGEEVAVADDQAVAGRDDREIEAALVEYWSAKTPQQEMDALRRARRAGWTKGATL